MIPEHLKPFVAKQDPALYTPIDHASWRFILRVSRDFFSSHAHSKYLQGLEDTGISTERIPLVAEMDAKLSKFGWRAIPVSGFIPPAAFMEFQSLGILPIAAEMRTLEHLAYTPAPDIVHEAAGHAPIIADPEYAAYLKAYGTVARKAIFSDQDMAVYNAVYGLSVVKEDPKSTPQDIEAAQKQLDHANAQVTYLSEANLLARMNWWTVEYGLVGSLDDPKIYGAGLLSSVGESFHCLDAQVMKVPFTLDCIFMGYDITRPQPQLFVTPDFHSLTRVLGEFAEMMAYKRGGEEGLGKAQLAQTVCTVELESGIQLSGVVESFKVGLDGKPSFIKLNGPAQLGFGDVELDGHSPKYHREGFSTPIGKVVLRTGAERDPQSLTQAELAAEGFVPGATSTLEFSSGIRVQGKLDRRLERGGRTLVLSFEACTVTDAAGTILFKPEWGTYDLACGAMVASVFGGAADRGAYMRAIGTPEQPARPLKCNLTPENRALNDLYARVRAARLAGKSQASVAELAAVADELGRVSARDWLLRIELLELDRTWALGAAWAKSLQSALDAISSSDPVAGEMIARGRRLIA